MNLRKNHKQHILIVDDDRDTCTVLNLLLTANGFQSSVTYSGLEAIEFVQHAQPDIILLDFMMPEVDGMMTFERLKEYSAAPVIFLTAVQSGELAASAFESGVSDYMRKPFHSKELIARVRQQLGYVSSEDQAVLQEELHEFDVSIIIPVYNEEEALPVVLTSLQSIIDETYEVIVVDDGSSDGSANIAASFPCKLIKHEANLGKGAAMQTGIRASAGKKILFIDADNTYPVEYIPEMVRMMDSFDLVRGARVLGRNNIPLVNRLGNHLFDGVIRVLHSVEGDDVLSGMYGGGRESLSRLDLTSAGFDIEAEIGAKAKAHGLRITTVPITYTERIGEKKLKVIKDGFRILYRVFQLAITYNPMIAFITPGVLIFLIGMVLMTVFVLKPDFSVNAEKYLFISGGLTNLGAQIVIFGLAVYSAGLAYGLRGRANGLLDRLAALFYDRRLMISGMVLGLAGFSGLIWNIITSWLTGAPILNNTAFVVTGATSMVIGMQILISMAFFSALKGLEHNLTSINGANEGVVHLEYVNGRA